MPHAIYRVVTFEIIGPHQLRVRFDDGVSCEIDFQPILNVPLYQALQQLTVFNGVRIDPEIQTLVRGWIERRMMQIERIIVNPSDADRIAATMHRAGICIVDRRRPAPRLPTILPGLVIDHHILRLRDGEKCEQQEECERKGSYSHKIILGLESDLRNSEVTLEDERSPVGQIGKRDRSFAPPVAKDSFDGRIYPCPCLKAANSAPSSSSTIAGSVTVQAISSRKRWR